MINDIRAILSNSPAFHDIRKNKWQTQECGTLVDPRRDTEDK